MTRTTLLCLAAGAALLLAACGPTSGGAASTTPPVASSSAASTGAGTATAGDMDAVAAASQKVADTLVGMTEADATAAAAQAGLTVRVVARDGQHFPVTMDYSPTRVNLDIEAGKVTKATVG